MKIFDFFAVNISLFTDKSVTYNTKFGGLVSISISILIILLIIAFGQDFYNRTNPQMVRETEITPDYPIYDINNKNFSIAIRIEDHNGNKAKDNNILILKGFYKYYEKVNGEWTGSAVKLNLTDCTDEMFESKESYYKYGFNSFMCPVLDNIKFGGSWSGSKVGYFIFQTYLCSKGAIINYDDNSPDEECQTDVPYDAVGYETLGFYPYMSVYYQQALVTSSNYTNGLQKNMVNKYFLLDNTLALAEYYYFQVVKMVTDYGWILKSKEEEVILGLNRVSANFALIKFYKYADRIGLMYFYLDPNIDLHNREYMKIQILAANVGGIIKIFFVIAQFILTFYNQTDMLFELSKKLYERNIPSDKLAAMMNKDCKIQINNYVGVNEESMEQIKNKAVIPDLKLNKVSDKNNIKKLEEYENKTEVEKENKINNGNKNSRSDLPPINKQSLNHDVKDILQTYESPFYYYLYMLACCVTYKNKYRINSAILSHVKSLLEVQKIIKIVDKENFGINS